MKILTFKNAFTLIGSIITLTLIIQLMVTYIVTRPTTTFKEEKELDIAVDRKVFAVDNSFSLEKLILIFIAALVVLVLLLQLVDLVLLLRPGLLSFNHRLVKKLVLLVVTLASSSLNVDRMRHTTLLILMKLLSIGRLRLNSECVTLD